MDSIPAKPKLVTSQVGLWERSSVWWEKTVFLGDNNNSLIPADGVVSEWQFHVKHSGQGAFQVWRRQEGAEKRYGTVPSPFSVSCYSILARGSSTSSIPAREPYRCGDAEKAQRKGTCTIPLRLSVSCCSILGLLHTY